MLSFPLYSHCHPFFRFEDFHCSALHRQLLPTTMASADSLQFTLPSPAALLLWNYANCYIPSLIATSARSPRVSSTTFISSICHIYSARFGQYWTSLCYASSSALHCLKCDSCNSDRDFALGFLQIPPHDGHPCPLLTVPTAKSVTVFHRLVVAHAWRTSSRRLPIN